MRYVMCLGFTGVEEEQEARRRTAKLRELKNFRQFRGKCAARGLITVFTATLAAMPLLLWRAAARGSRCGGGGCCGCCLAAAAFFALRGLGRVGAQKAIF